MPTSDLSDTVIVFDLDDTLYPEDAYVRSGIAAACRLAAIAHGVDHTDTILARWAAGERDWLTALCEKLPSSPSMRESLIWAYRLHEPRIALQPEAHRLVTAVIRRARAVAVLTDGRSVTQRLKLRALGLSALPAYISDEHGGSDKPDGKRFHAVMQDFRASNYVYVADNPAKDFLAPNALGWLTFGILGSSSRIHKLDEFVPDGYRPDHWADSLERLLEDWAFE